MHSKPRRPRGTGSIVIRNGSYYGKWWAEGRSMMRKLGPVRQPGTRDGLTKTMAEKQLRKLVSEIAPPAAGERLTVQEAGERHIQHLETMGRKPSTLRSYRNILGTHITPRIGSRPIAQLTSDEVEALIASLIRDGSAPKTVRNATGLLHSICRHAVKRGWATTNPCSDIDLPAVPDSHDIRFLDPAELEAVLRTIDEPSTDGRYTGPDFRRVHHAIVLTAAMSGLRQGELLALRWQDIDWAAQRIRVRRNFVRGQLGTPKTRRGSRAVPLADRVGGELDQLHRRSYYQADDDLVFGNPHTGEHLGADALRRAFQRAIRQAGLGHHVFHDLRHTFGTRMAAAGVPMRTLQEWMGHRDLQTTLIYADYAPGAHEADLVNDAFGPSVPQTVPQTEQNSDQLQP